MVNIFRLTTGFRPVMQQINDSDGRMTKPTDMGPAQNRNVQAPPNVIVPKNVKPIAPRSPVVEPDGSGSGPGIDPGDGGAAPGRGTGSA